MQHIHYVIYFPFGSICIVRKHFCIVVKKHFLLLKAIYSIYIVISYEGNTRIPTAYLQPSLVAVQSDCTCDVCSSFYTLNLCVCLGVSS